VENNPAIFVTSASPVPGADAVVWERHLRWANEVYMPLQMKIPECTGYDAYRVIREHPDYGIRLSLNHYHSLRDYKTAQEAAEQKAIIGEIESWRERGIRDQFWSAAFALLKSYRNRPVFNIDNRDTRIENAPIIHLEAYRLSAAELEQYLKWFNDFAGPVFMPLIMKLPGLAGYDWYKDTGLRTRQGEWEYPEFFSLIYFENFEAFDNYTKSPELAGFQKALRSLIPRRLGYVWYIQYELTHSLRK
jgi:heme-degrading monooxygenase HmoA